MVNKLVRTSKNGSLLFEPEIPHMSTDPISLMLMARNKMHSSSGGKDTCSLHRWVLLKNSFSVCSSQSVTNPSPANHSTNIDQLYSIDNNSHFDYPTEGTSAGHVDTFLFPDAGNLVSTSHSGGSEAAWLDTLLRALVEDEDEDDLGEPDVVSPAIPVDDDEEETQLSPITSPMASSDDLYRQDSYFSSAHPNLPFSVPYQSCSYQDINSPISSLPAPYEDPLPYHDSDDMRDYSVPEALLEDTSDDESDAPSTPSFGRSSASLTFCDAHSTSPPESSLLRPSLYSDKDPFFYPPDVDDPLPFPYAHRNAYNAYQQY
ncbi:hypothetical protein JOM56_003909 [Amanita muscaria]